MVHHITKIEYKRVKSLRKINARNIPKGVYFIAPDNKAYKSDKTGYPGVEEQFKFCSQMKKELQAQLELI